MTRARDLSKLSNSQAFSVDNDFNVGINSSVPTAALDVRGNTVISGVLTATSFSGDGSALTGVANTENVIGTAITMTTGTFTGNVSVGGTLTGNVTGTASLASNLTGSPNISVGTITATGNVSVGGTLTYEDVTNVDSVGVITARSDVSIADKIVHTGDTNTAIRFPAADTFTVETGGSEAIRVDSSQRLLKGHTSSESMLYTGGIQVQGTNSSTSAITVKSNQADSGGPALVLGKSRGALGGTTVVQSGDQLGSIYFNGADGTDTNTAAAEIRGAVDGTPGSNDMPGRLMFFTTADGASSPTERLRVASSGQIGLGGANYGTSGQVITSNGSGSAPTWQNSEGNTLDLVASGAIADGDTVVIRTDGKVGIVTGTGGAEGKGSFATAEQANSQNIRVTNAGTNKIVMTYNDGGNSSYITAVVGTISGTSITFGTPVASFNTSNSEQHTITYDSNADKVVIAFRAENFGTKTGTAVVGTISGNSISFGSDASFDQYSGNPAACFDSDNNKIIICYRDGNNGNYGTGVVGTVSGTSISFGTATAWNSQDSEFHSVCYIGDSQVVDAFHNNGDNSKGYAVVGNVSGTSISFGTQVKFTDDQDIRNISCVYDDANDKVVIIYTDNSGNRKALVGTVSGTGASATISFGSATTFGQTSSNVGTPHMHAIYSSFLDKVVVAYRDGDNSDKGTVALATVSGTDISFGTGFVYEADGYTDFNWPATANEQNIFIGYRDYSDSSHARGVVYSAPFTNTNVTGANFIGISDGAYTDGQTAKIRFAGVDDAQVGLTTGSFYYVQPNGDLGTSAGNPSVEAGVAISATQILLKKNQ